MFQPDEENLDAEAVSKPAVRVLSFFLENERYCIDIASAKEAFKPTSITKVPNVPPFVLGVTNLHGDIIPILDIKHFLGLGHKEAPPGAKVIVADIGTNPIGIMVDDIGEALDIEDGSVQPPLVTINEAMAKFTKGQIALGRDILVYLDLSSIWDCEEIIRLRKG